MCINNSRPVPWYYSRTLPVFGLHVRNELFVYSIGSVDTYARLFHRFSCPFVSTHSCLSYLFLNKEVSSEFLPEPLLLLKPCTKL